jgi:hypothetical protein
MVLVNSLPDDGGQYQAKVEPNSQQDTVKPLTNARKAKNKQKIRLDNTDECKYGSLHQKLKKKGREKLI